MPVTPAQIQTTLTNLETHLSNACKTAAQLNSQCEAYVDENDLTFGGVAKAREAGGDVAGALGIAARRLADLHQLLNGIAPPGFGK
ncbi:hypothetical protein ACLB6G_20245 [Zhengella sp. ZM62]|uniref:hypothetical protein n=1 Tax=Zhengella sedimenti TaxID=3390035 RepID=UPI00397542E5